MENELKFNAKELPPQDRENLRKKIVRQMEKHGDTGRVAEICE